MNIRIGSEGFTMSAIITAAAAILHKVPALLILFMLAVLADYLTGWVKARYFLREWNSKQLYHFNYR